MLRVALASRSVMLLAAVGAALGAVLMIWEGGAKLFHATQALAGGHAGAAATATATVMGATDAFLFALVLLIFAYSITFGFVLDLSHADRDRLPAWMRITGVGDLKRTLVEVILVYLVVDFATDVAEAADLSWETLILPISIVLIAAALRILPGHRASTDARH